MENRTILFNSGNSENITLFPGEKLKIQKLINDYDTRKPFLSSLFNSENKIILSIKQIYAEMSNELSLRDLINLTRLFFRCDWNMIDNSDFSMNFISEIKILIKSIYQNYLDFYFSDLNFMKFVCTFLQHKFLNDKENIKKLYLIDTFKEELENFCIFHDMKMAQLPVNLIDSYFFKLIEIDPYTDAVKKILVQHDISVFEISSYLFHLNEFDYSCRSISRKEIIDKKISDLVELNKQFPLKNFEPALDLIEKEKTTLFTENNKDCMLIPVKELYTFIANIKLLFLAKKYSIGELSSIPTEIIMLIMLAGTASIMRNQKIISFNGLAGSELLQYTFMTDLLTNVSFKPKMDFSDIFNKYQAENRESYSYFSNHLLLPQVPQEIITRPIPIELNNTLIQNNETPNQSSSISSLK